MAESATAQRVRKSVTDGIRLAYLPFCPARGNDRMQRMKTAHEELESFMLTQIQERKAELRGQIAGGKRDDVFSLLIRANEEDAVSQGDGKKHATLSNQELVSKLPLWFLDRNFKLSKPLPDSQCVCAPLCWT